MSDLDKFREEIESFLKKEGFSIFPYRNGSFSEFISEFKWSDIENWEEFFTLAKKEGITTIFENIGRISSEDLESFKNNSDSEVDEDAFEDIQGELEANLDEVSSISFFWIKNNIQHTITKHTSWLDDLSKKIREFQKQKQVKKLEQRKHWEERRDEDVPKKYIGKEEDIAKQFLEHLEIEHPGAGASELWNIRQNYFQSLGINNYSNKHRIFTNKVSAIADKIIAQKERDRIPELIEKCVEWAVENEIDKPTQAILRGFLAEDNINLTSNNFKILHTKVTLELKNWK